MRILSKTLISSSVFLVVAAGGIAQASPDMDADDAMAEAAFEEADEDFDMEMQDAGESVGDTGCEDEADCEADDAAEAEEAAPASADGETLPEPGSTTEGGGGGSADPGGRPVKD
ncbi:hypothetical protein [Hyphomonas sp.]|uniref:hypothetical protein n=1 Tax=Hyphomonas sp. TaxID=87 RepID=UPI0032EDA664